MVEPNVSAGATSAAETRATLAARGGDGMSEVADTIKETVEHAEGGGGLTTLVAVVISVSAAVMAICNL